MTDIGTPRMNETASEDDRVREAANRARKTTESGFLNTLEKVISGGNQSPATEKALEAIQQAIGSAQPEPGSAELTVEREPVPGETRQASTTELNVHSALAGVHVFVKGEIVALRGELDELETLLDSNLQQVRTHIGNHFHLAETATAATRLIGGKLAELRALIAGKEYTHHE
jgi:hypothetical protein